MPIIGADMAAALENARKEFLGHLRDVRQVSPHTLRAYDRDLQRLFDFLKADSGGLPAPRDVRSARLRLHLAELAAEGLAGTSLARHLSTLRSFFGVARKWAGMADSIRCAC